MNPSAMLIAGLVILPAIGLVTWTWFVMGQVEEELGCLSRCPFMRDRR